MLGKVVLQIVFLLTTSAVFCQSPMDIFPTPKVTVNPSLTVIGHLPQAPSPVLKVAKAGNTFALDLYKLLANQKNKNLFFSPISIHLVLAMAYAGAKSETAKEMAQVLHYETTFDGKLVPAFSDYIRILNETCFAKPTEGNEIAVANSIWGSNKIEFDPGFLKSLVTDFLSELNTVNFEQTEEARTKINQWVSIKTRQKINELIPPGAINSLTKIVLTNAIYFKGFWDKQFSKAATKDELFHSFGSNPTPTKMMNLTANFGYFENDDFQGLRMDYKGEHFSLFAFLPKKNDGLDKFDENFTVENFEKWLLAFHQKEVIVSFPKFKIEDNFELEQTLKKMGLSKAFSEKVADFSGMVTPKQWEMLESKDNRIVISKVIHKALVDVSEEGTEAAAATASVLEETSRADEPTHRQKVFKADHPFMFVIRHNPTGAILFMGRVVNPR